MRQDHRKGPPSAGRLDDCNLLKDSSRWAGPAPVIIAVLHANGDGHAEATSDLSDPARRSECGRYQRGACFITWLRGSA